MGRARDTAAAIRWARKTAESDDWVVLDTSSTGFTDSAVVTQVGVTDSAGDVLLDTLVKPPPRKRITDRDLEEIDVDKETLKAAPDYSDVKAQLEAVIGDRTVLSYNKNFRERVFRQTAQRVDDSPPQLRWGDCVMERYASFIGEWMKDDEGYKWQKLPKGNNAKGAISDSLAIRDLIHRMAGEDIPEAATREPKQKAGKEDTDEKKPKRRTGCLFVVLVALVLVVVIVGLI